MPRDSNGVYSLPVGNPVATLTVISSNWANTTLSDLSTAMTASLSRAGEGAMLAGLKLFDGTIGAPGMTWGTETTAGFYRASAGNFRFAIGGVDVMTLVAGGLSFGLANGTAGAPSLFFASDPDTGIFRFGANSISLSAGGTSGLTVDTVAAHFRDGTVGQPGITFISDPDSGIYRVGVNQIAMTVAGTLMLGADVSFGARSYITHVFVDGAAATPSLTFANDTDTGIYRIAANRMGVTFGGVVQMDLSAAQISLVPPLWIANGTAGAPGIAFGSDTDTGIYRAGANQLTFAAGAGTIMNVTPTTVNFNQHIDMIDGSVGAPGYSFGLDTNTGIYRGGVDLGSLCAGGVNSMDWDNSVTGNDTRIIIYCVAVGASRRVLTGALNSGGAGFRQLLVAN